MLLRILSDSSVPEKFDSAEAAAWMPDVRNVWTDGSLVLDEVKLLSPLQVRYFSLNSLDFAGALVGWVMLIMFVLMVVVRGSLVEVFVRYLGHYRPSKKLTFAVSFLLCNLLCGSFGS